jgi:uncharacterized OsmC-like protein
MSEPPPVRTYEVHAATTSTFGRVRVGVREHALTVDGPVQNGCPGEAPTPVELLLAAVASCGTELVEVLARDEGVPLRKIAVAARGTIDRDNQPREDVTVLNEVALDFALSGPTQAQAEALVAAFQRRCPIYGTLAVASLRVDVTVRAGA